MEEERKDLTTEESTQPEQEQPGYVPRPRWQVWGARIALVVFILILIAYYLNLFRGGL